MNDHETAIIESKREDLLKERKEIEEEFFKRMPLREKVYSYVFGITFVGMILFGVWFVGRTAYVLIFKSL